LIEIIRKTLFVLMIVFIIVVGGYIAIRDMPLIRHAEPYSDVSTPRELFYTSREQNSESEPFTVKAKSLIAETTTEYVTVTTEVAKEPVTEWRNPVPGDYIGTFTLTAYEWTGYPMANGEYPYYGACASNYFALGTVLYIEGYGTFTVCDRGSMANNVIDIYLGGAQECIEFGRRTAEVYYG